MKFNKLLCLLSLVIINLYFTGCTKWITNSYYDFPIWKQPSDTFYCVEIEEKEKHTYPIDLSLILDTEVNSYLINSDLDGNVNRVCLIDSAEGYRVVNISISEDLVVYEKLNNSICSIKTDGTNNQELIAGSCILGGYYCGQSYFSCLSNDGEKIVYEVYKDSEREWEIWLMDATGTNKYKIYTSTTILINPIWSPDNKEVGFADVDEYRIRIINIETLNSYLDSNISGLKFDFTPDNLEIIYKDQYNLMIMSKDGTNRRVLFSDANLGGVDHIRISPDKSKVLLRHNRYDEVNKYNDTTICIINIDGTDYKEILLPKHESKSFLQNLF